MALIQEPWHCEDLLGASIFQNILCSPRVESIDLELVSLR
jgi:hypothetical protein